MERSIVMPLGVVVERQQIDHPWQKWRWLPVAVIPGAPAVTERKEIARGERFVRWHAATLPLELHRKETEAYRYNLSTRRPSVYVLLRKAEGTAEHPFRPLLVTASPYDAQDYLDSAEDIVEGVPMPPGLIAWVQAFIDRHPPQAPFEKRKRKRFDADEAGLGRRPDGSGAPPGHQRGRHGQT